MGFLVLSLALFGLHKIFRSAMGKTRAVIGLVAAAGFEGAGLANLLGHCAGLDALGFAYVIGLMLGMLLLIAFGVFLRRVGLPGWCTWFLCPRDGARHHEAFPLLNKTASSFALRCA